jgi:colanic acid biosynthesis glycosyl transferase WcaI
VDRSLNVVVVCPVFPPEPVVSAQTSYQVAEEMTRRGHRVRVITAFPNRPAGKLYPGYRRRLVRKESSEAGFEVTRCFSLFSTESSMISRFLENISFGISSSLLLLFAPRADVIYSLSWPIFAAGLLSLVARLRGIPVVGNLQDIYPESLISQSRVSPNHWIVRLIRQVDGWIARSFGALILISERFVQPYERERKVPAENIYVISNWVDSVPAEAAEAPSSSYRLSRGISRDKFLLVYGGNIGIAAGVEGLMDALQSPHTPERLVLLVAGSGSQLESCRKLATELPDGRVLFHSPWEKDETYEVLRAADVLVLPTRGDQSRVSVPSKLMSYMLAARPVVAQAWADSEIAHIIASAGCGWVVDPEQPDQLAAVFDEISSLPATVLVQKGKAGRDYALEHSTTEVNAPLVAQILENTAIGKRNDRG